MTAALVLLLAAGPPLAAVRIVAPEDEIAQARRYVALRPGDPLDPEAVRRDVRHLHATGRYEDVVVESVDTPAGPELVFRLAVVARLRDVVIEGTPVISARTVRRVSRLRPGEALWPIRLDAAARDVALHLAGEGYLEARVTASVRSGPAGAVAVFEIVPGTRVRVGEVRIEGTPPGESLEGWARPRPGELFHRSDARRAAQKMAAWLRRRGRGDARVTVDEAYDPSRGRVAVTFRVEPGPPTRTEFRGDAVPSSIVSRAEGDLQSATRAEALEEAADAVEEAFRRRGYREARVTAQIEGAAPGPSLTVFDVSAGSASRVKSVALEGAMPVRAPALATRTGDPLMDETLEADRQSLLRSLQDGGYAAAAVEVDAEPGGAVDVVFRVRPGPRATIRSVAVRFPPGGPPAGFTARELRTRTGAPYRTSDVVRDRDGLLAACRNEGYLQAEVRPEVTLSEEGDAADVVFEAQLGEPVHIDRIIVAGLDRTRETVVRRELLVSEGQPLSLQRLLDSQRRLGTLGILDGVRLRELDPESPRTRSLVVEAQELPTTTVTYGIGYSEQDLLRVSAEVSRRNLSGLDRSLSAFVRASVRGNRFLTTYREPYLFGRRQELFITGFREEEERETFGFVRFGTTFQTARQVSSRWSLILRYTTQETRVFDVQIPLEDLDREFRSTTYSGPAASVVNDGRDDPLDPRRGHFVGADAQLSHRLLGGDSFVKAYVQGAVYRPLRRNVLLAAGARLGAARTLGDDVPVLLPLPDRFFAGGDYSLRGFRLDSVGPREPSSTGELVATGGNALLLAAAELRFDAGRYLGVAAFTDAGNVYETVSTVDASDLRYTAGLGLRYKSAFGPIRIDWGYKLNRRPGESPGQFHVTVGHAF